MNSASDWIALAALCLTVLGGVLYLGRLWGQLPGRIVDAIRDHERHCANWEPNTGVQAQALREHYDRIPTVPGGVPLHPGGTP